MNCKGENYSKIFFHVVFDKVTYHIDGVKDFPFELGNDALANLKMKQITALEDLHQKHPDLI